MSPLGIKKRALAGIRVIDCSVAMAGPFAAQRLGDLGADVIKVEPTTGEWQRHASAGGAQGNRINVSFLSLNRNKRSLAIDLKAGQSAALMNPLIESADVFLQNYRPGVAKRLGLDYETLREINPRIIYVSISGYGEDGPYAQRPGQDLLLQAMSGAMFSAGREGTPPLAAGEFLVDSITANVAFEGALAALFHRERTGEGQHVSVNMLDVITAQQMQELSVFTVGGVEQKRSAEPHAHAYIRAPYGTFATSDGYLALAFAHLPDLGRLIGEPSFLEMIDEVHGWTHRDELFAKTASKLKSRSTQEWFEIFTDAGIWSAPVYTYKDLVEDPQIAHNGTFVEYEHPTEGHIKTPGFPFKFSETPPSVRFGAPVVGQHTSEILAELGFGSEEIKSLLDQGVITEEAV